jgi:hypothetical protein
VLVAAPLVGVAAAVGEAVVAPDGVPVGVVEVDDGVGAVDVTVGARVSRGFLVWVAVGVGPGVVVCAGVTTTSGGGGGRTSR